MKAALSRVLAHALLSALVVACALALYHRMVVRPALVVGVVDVAEVYRAKEAAFTRMLTAGPTDQERQQALLLAGAFARRLPGALEELQRECNCLVVLKSAIAGATAHTVDLTARLQAKVDAP